MTKFCAPGFLALSMLLINPAQALGPVATPDSGGTLTTLYSFNGYTDGADPEAALVEGPDGNYYGTATGGGQYGGGSVFKITPAGAVTILYAFTEMSDGANPFGGLVLGSDGNFYGTTGDSGTSGAGTVFKMTPQGVLTTLHEFVGTDGAYPYAAMVLGRDGNFYGTTEYGGANDSGSYGTIFKISPSGSYTQMYNFSGPDGANPTASLIIGADGNFYGTTLAGGSANVGTVFKITPAGALTTLYSFNTADGANPQGAVVQGTDGNLYGTTAYGGSNNIGTVFQLTPSGVLTTLHTFKGLDGSTPFAPLIQASDGSFYGTTVYDGSVAASKATYIGGTLFKITSTGAFTSLYSFTARSAGTRPLAALLQGSDGAFYGSTFLPSATGSGEGGIIFKYSN